VTNKVARRFPALIGAPADPTRIWLVLQLGVPVAGQPLSNPDVDTRRATPDG
jgi:hypothetical protein